MVPVLDIVQIVPYLIIMLWSSISFLSFFGMRLVFSANGTNNALLGKWLQRIGKDADSLWKNVILEKYDVRREGWDVEGPSYCFSNLWKGVVSIKNAFAGSIKYWVGSSNKVLFWHDTWVGDRPLAVQFPNLYRCARDTKAKVSDYMERGSGQILSGPIFRKFDKS